MKNILFSLGIFISLTGYSRAQMRKAISRTDIIETTNAKIVKSDKPNEINRALVLKDSSIVLTANIRLDCRIFGYAKPNVFSKRMFLLSVFTDDVKGNPFHCTFGAYYETGDREGLKLKFTGRAGKFIKASISKETLHGVVYIEKKWVRFVNF